ncbi:MAG: tetratricopeptide repeat protein [Myxococcaceae bacterium]
MSEHKPELDRELADIRREVIESRNLVIKNDNLLKNLHAELKAVGKRQEDFQKKQIWSSAFAYALFAILAGAAAVGYSTARVSGASDEASRLQKAVTDLTAQLEQARDGASKDQLSRKAASEVYKMMTQLPGEERIKGIDALAKIDAARLSPLEKQVLDERAGGLRVELGQASFERGKTAFRRNEFQRAAEELTRFMAMNPSTADQLEAAFYLGSALSQLRRHDQAIPHLQRFVKEDRRSKVRDYGMLMLATSYEATGQLDKAAETARDALGTYPESQFGPQFRGRLSSVKRQLAAASSAATDAPAATGAATPPAGAGPPSPAAPPQAVSGAAPAAVVPASAPAAPATAR